MFAIAFVTHLVNGLDVGNAKFDAKLMREHLIKCLEKIEMTSFPVSKALAELRKRPIYSLSFYRSSKSLQTIVQPKDCTFMLCMYIQLQFSSYGPVSTLMETPMASTPISLSLVDRSSAYISDLSVEPMVN